MRRLQCIGDLMGKSLKELVLDDWASTIELFERDMIFHPQTGEIIGDATEGEFAGLCHPAGQEALADHIEKKVGA